MGTNQQKLSADAAEGWQHTEGKLDRLVTELFVLARHPPQGGAFAHMRSKVEQFMESQDILKMRKVSHGKTDQQ